MSATKEKPKVDDKKSRLQFRAPLYRPTDVPLNPDTAAFLAALRTRVGIPIMPPCDCASAPCVSSRCHCDCHGERSS